MASKKKVKRGNVRVPDPLFSKLKSAAVTDQRSFNALALIILKEGLERRA